MKMSKELFDSLKSVIDPLIATDTFDKARSEYKLRGLTHTRLVWDLFHASNFGGKRLYDSGLNDSHITTALKKIIPWE